MSGEAAAYVDAFVRQNPETVRFFRHVYVPDELFFQTILGNSPLRESLICDTPHYLEWDRPGNVLVAGDFGNLAATYHLFARKFESRVDATVLDLIDEQLLDA